MQRKRTVLVVITVAIMAFVAICTWYSFTKIKSIVMEQSVEKMEAVASQLVAAAKDTSDLGELDIYHGNAEVFIIDKQSYEVLYNSHNVKISPEIHSAFAGNSTVADMACARESIDDERELVLFAPERIAYSAVYDTEKAFVILIAVEAFAFAAYIYLVFANSKRAVEKTLLEERLKKAEDADAAKSLFISNMSHDLRTPMNSSIGFTDLAIENAGDEEKVTEYLKKVKSADSHLLTLVNDIIDVTRIENGTISIKPEPNNLFALAAGIEEMVRPDIEGKKLTFATDYSGIIDENVYCDRLHLFQVFLNIFSNAEKFTQPGGTVNFSISQKTSANEKGMATYEFRVRDNGIGIGANFLEHVYEPFVRENTPAVSRTPGAGLGLTITKNIVDLMDGSIAVKSEPNVGTEFILKFNFVLSNSAATAPVFSKHDGPVAENKFVGRKILLVEDNELNREMAKELLEEKGLVVNDVDDGTVAVATMERAKPGEYAAILMDIQMPTMDGYEATQHIRQLPNSAVARTPIVAMTANAFDEDRQKSRAAGMNAHINKPIDIEKLLKVLEKYM